MAAEPPAPAAPRPQEFRVFDWRLTSSAMAARLIQSLAHQADVSKKTLAFLESRRMCRVAVLAAMVMGTGHRPPPARPRVAALSCLMNIWKMRQ
ncbi:hypothetical protein E2C01_067785 [Portunus trituberculatus]|uniref:Uncharacterized protein n=1 Tax=Portunus trituberculatus TaxID=210409 RepID=A0A5B7HW27_PORTR|nr:hypothetical protein [Portunus trituberculatus]